MRFQSKDSAVLTQFCSDLSIQYIIKSTMESKLTTLVRTGQPVNRMRSPEKHSTTIKSSPATPVLIIIIFSCSRPFYSDTRHDREENTNAALVS